MRLSHLIDEAVASSRQLAERDVMMTAEASRRRRRGNAVDGVLLLDKPLGFLPTPRCKRCAGCSGASRLDTPGRSIRLPPVCCRCAWERPPSLPAACSMPTSLRSGRSGLGVTTTTGDAEGEPISRRAVAGALQRVPEVLAAFYRRDRPDAADVQRAQAPRAAALQLCAGRGERRAPSRDGL